LIFYSNLNFNNEYLCFDSGLEVETKSELLEAAQSYDIMSDMELIGVRRRSNTAQRLERLKKERKSQSKVKVIQWRDNPYLLTGDWIDYYII
jgi:hypothetical protein